MYEFRYTVLPPVPTCSQYIQRVKNPKSTDPEIPKEAFLRTLLQESKKYAVEPEEAAYLSLMLVLAAADTV
jgi:hypothetical protein